MKKNKEPNPNFTYLCRTIPNQRVTLLQGSTRSGKTYAICYWIMWFCMNHRGAGIEIDITRDSFTSLMSTIWKDFKTIAIEHGLYNDALHNKTNHIYNLFGNTISYYGADNPEKIHGRSRDILIVNEAHQFPESTIDQLFPRTRQRIICDYNPALGVEHWLDKYIEEYPPLITTYKDNPHLTKAQVEDIESRKGNKYWWAVYGEGKRANREGVIFEDWVYGDFDNSLPYIYGQDFGFYPDPTTLIKVAADKDRKILYLHECYYNNNHLTTSDIYEMNKTYIQRPDDLIVADSAEPRLIYEVAGKGLNVQRAKKGEGSVLYGLNKMVNYKIVVTTDSKNLAKELSKYIWNDKRSGIPIDSHNHLIDAARYAFIRLVDIPNIQPVGMDNLV